MSDIQYSYHNVTNLARRLGGHVALFDLETTTFRGRANFGIMEVAVAVITMQGDLLTLQALINPERNIDPTASAITGLTQKDVAGAELWGDRYAALFAKMAKEQWVGGFNNHTFDQPAVIDMNARYGQKFEKFEKSFDVRNLHLDLSNSKSRKGNLLETAALYGVTPRGALHRAKADTILTMELLDGIIALYGLDAVCDRIQPKPEGAFDVLSAKSVAKYVKSKASVTVPQLAKAFGKDVGTAAFEVGKAIDERLVSPEVFAVQSAQEWLDAALVEVDAQLLSQGKLKPLHDVLVKSQPEVGMVDYVQLRIALLRAGVPWASLKPQ